MPNRKLFAFLTVVVLTFGLFWGVTSVAADATKTKTLISGQGAMGARDGANKFSLDGGATFAPAYILPVSVPSRPVNIPPGWAAPVSGTKWINFSRSAVSLQGASANSPQTTIYRTHFNLPATFDSPTLTVDVHADNNGDVYLNGNLVGSGADFSGSSSLFVDSVAAHFQKGRNVLEFHVTDFGAAAGLDYKATITYTAKGKGK